MWFWESKSARFAKYQARWPWPNNAKIEGVEPFQWSLDGGGRHLMQTLFNARPDCLLAELGSFMGGAPKKWMAENPGIKCVCVDPWDNDLIPYVRSLKLRDWAVNSYGVEKLDEWADLLEKHGPMETVRNNLVEFKDRCIMIRGRIPEIFPELASVKFKPDVVFIDALKQRDDFIKTHEAFPDAIIAGDDWSWGKREDGSYPIREFVEEVARARGAKIYAHKATFVVAERRHKLIFDERYLHAPENVAA